MFENFDYPQVKLVYLGLKALIEIKSGHGFHNADLGHPVYQMGSKGEFPKETDYADSPDKNILFKMLSELSQKIVTEEPEPSQYNWWYDFSEWQDFCKFAIDVKSGQR
jgi:hypothetical protein